MARADYTTLANRYTARFPVITYVGTQVNFWVVANGLLVIVLRLYNLIIGEIHHIQVPGDFATTLFAGVLLGLIYGLGFGTVSYYFDRKISRKWGLGASLLLKALASSVLFIVLFVLFRFVLFDELVSPQLAITASTLNIAAWRYLFYMMLIYYLFMTLLISFINQVQRKYGPGVLVPLLLGRYQHPREEEKIFMFMDLKSSTAAAEKLGHLKYSSFIRDCFFDINEVLHSHRAQVYQYVGDEIVVMWPVVEGLRDLACIRFYFAVANQIDKRREHYLNKYNLLPEFKAGMHMGKVTAVEIGEIKRDVAYHGDTLNTAARIQSVCNEYGCHFLVSNYLIQQTDAASYFTIDPLGPILLRGKSRQIHIVSVKKRV